MKTVNISPNRNSRLQSRCNGSALIVTFLLLSALGGFITLQTLRFYQKQQSTNREIRKTLARQQALLVVDEILRRFNERKVTFFAAEAEKSLHSYIVDTQLRDLGTDDFEQFFCPIPSDNASNTRMSLKILPKLSNNFVDKGDFTLETLRKRLKEPALTSKVPLLSASQKEMLSKRWRFFQTTKQQGTLKIPLFMPIFTFMGQKFDRKNTECALWNPYDRPLKGTLKFKCIAEILDEQGNLFVDPNIEFGLDITLPPGGKTTFSFDQHIANLERLLHVEIKNCPKAYERRAWDIPMTCTCGWPFSSETKFSRQPRNEARKNPKPPEPLPIGIVFNTQTQAQQLNTCLLFHCDKIYHSIGQREQMFFSDAQNSKDILWNIFLQASPPNSIPFYFFGTDKELFEAYPSTSDKKKFLKFFTQSTENFAQPTKERLLISNQQPLSVLQANIDTLIIFSCFETQFDLCICETEIKHTANGTWEPQTTRYHYQRKPKTSQKPILPPKPPPAEPIILKSSDVLLEEVKISPATIVRIPENAQKDCATPKAQTVILEVSEPSIPIETVENPIEKIPHPPVDKPLRKRRKNSPPVSVTFTRLKEEDESTKQSTESKK